MTYVLHRVCPAANAPRLFARRFARLHITAHQRLSSTSPACSGYIHCPTESVHGRGKDDSRILPDVVHFVQLPDLRKERSDRRLAVSVRLSY